MQYEEKETTLAEGDYVLLYSDGLVEAHNEAREMFGFPRLQTLLAAYPDGTTVTDYLLAELATFTGPAWEQEDDVTLVSLQRAAQPPAVGAADAWQTMQQFELASKVGNERQAMEQVAAIVADLPLTASQLERLKTAVAEATMNAMEHGNHYDPTTPVRIEVAKQEATVRVRIVDQGGGKPVATAETPDLEAKLEGAQSPRGWGLFLIENMVDEMQVRKEGAQHTVELFMNLSGDRGE
jgi:anti-sigma regulatory factor (Ser/Thr protein kinase)